MQTVTLVRICHDELGLCRGLLGKSIRSVSSGHVFASQ